MSNLYFPIFRRLLLFLNKGHQRSVTAKKNIFASFGLKAFSLIISFIKVPIILNYLDVEKYGVWLTIASIVNWVHHFDLGIGHGFRNKFAIAIANNDKEKAQHLVSAAYFYLSLIFGSLAIIIIPVIIMLDWQVILNVTSIENSELLFSVLIVFLMFILRFIFNLITMLLKADQKTALADSFLPIGNVIALILVFFLNTFSKDSLFLACLVISSPPVIAVFMANIILFARKYADFKPMLTKVRKKYFNEIFSLGMKFFLIQMASLVMFSSSNIILTQLVNPAEVTLFNIARQYYGLPFMLYGIILAPMWSAITEAYTRNDFEWIKNSMNMLLKISIFFTGGLMLMFIFSNYAIRFWLKGQVVIPFDLSVAMLALNILLIFFAPYSSFINGVGKLNLGLRVVVIKILGFLPVAIFLTQYLSAVGLTLSLILVNSLPSSIIEKMQYSKLMKKTARGIWDK